MANKREQCRFCKTGCPENIFQAQLNRGRIPFDKCMDFTPKQTNADRIRAMSVEELAEFFSHYISCGYCAARDNQCNTNTCVAHLLKWLQSEVEE